MITINGQCFMRCQECLEDFVDEKDIFIWTKRERNWRGEFVGKQKKTICGSCVGWRREGAIEPATA